MLTLSELKKDHHRRIFNLEGKVDILSSGMSGEKPKTEIKAKAETKPKAAAKPKTEAKPKTATKKAEPKKEEDKK